MDSAFQSGSPKLAKLDLTSNTIPFKDCLSDMSYLNKLRNNLDIGAKKASLYTSSTYGDGYKSPSLYSPVSRSKKPFDSRLFQESPSHFSMHQPKTNTVVTLPVMPSYSPLTNSNQVMGISFRGKSIYKANFQNMTPSRLLTQSQSSKDHLKGIDIKGGDYVFKSTYNKGYQSLERSLLEEAHKPQDNNHFFSDMRPNP